MLARDVDMLNGAGLGKQIRNDFSARERSEGERADEFLGGLREDHLDFVSVFDEETSELSGFISGDTAGYTEDDSQAPVPA
jgi:hypothetical protein